MVSGISNKWVLNAANLPASDLRAPKPHLAMGFPTFFGISDSTALIPDGGLPRQETTKSGGEFSINVLGRDGIEWSSRLLVEGNVCISRASGAHSLLPAATRFPH